MLAKIFLTQDELKEWLHYDPITGIFKWIKSPARCAKVGAVAGSLSGDKYWQIRLLGRNHKAHRLAWLFMTGEYPEMVIDHRDRNRSNNIFTNLRAADFSQNSSNAINNRETATNIRGVCLIKGRYEARIRHKGVYHYLGSFDTAEIAKAAYEEAAEELHGEYKFVETI